MGLWLGRGQALTLVHLPHRTAAWGKMAKETHSLSPFLQQPCPEYLQSPRHDGIEQRMYRWHPALQRLQPRGGERHEINRCTTTWDVIKEGNGKHFLILSFP
jgi:hypothetical protein